MPRVSIPMVGRTFGTLYVISEAEGSTPQNKKFRVRCSLCGATYLRLGGNIRRVVRDGATGCVCQSRAISHGRSSHPAYKVWSGMISRCHRPNHVAFSSYGGRGIRVCDEWRHSPAAFLDWCDKSGWSKGLQLDRIDNDRGYSAENCRFVTAQINQNNRRINRRIEVAGEVMTIAEASRRFGVKKTTIKERLNRGWDHEMAVQRVS